MNLKDLWIGEKVMIKSSGRVGTYEGTNSEGKARIKSGGKIYLVRILNLEIIPHRETFPDVHVFLDEEKPANKVKPSTIRTTFDHTLDLHIDKLAPHLLNESPRRIITYQIEKANSFVQDAIERNFPHITLIHGKGQGVLKREIEHILKNYPQIKFVFSKNGGGAFEIWL